LRHANVVGVVDVGEIDGLRYMVMDFAEGPDLAQLLAEAPMPAGRIIHLVRQMLEGLYHAHEQGLIHRDFKPENVIVEHDTHGAEMPRIIDFGIAILRDGGESVDAQGRLTTNGNVLGTPHYKAHEQAVADPIDHRIDLFALGIVIYEMLSGRLPFDGSGAEVARANLLLDPPPIAQRVPYLDVDPLLEAFARCLMAKKPKARPPTAKAAREVLDLIDHDRLVAAAVLGVPPELAGRAPLETTPLPSQQRASQYAVPESARTRRLRATPSQNEAVSPPVLAIPPTPPPIRAAPAALHVMPSAISAPRPRESQPIPNVAIQHDTSVRTPLSWPGTPVTTRRRPLVIAGAALGMIGIVALVLGRTGAKQPSPDERVVMAPIASSGTSPGATPADQPGDSPTATPRRADPTATPPEAVPTAPTPAAPTPATPTAAAPRTDPTATAPRPSEPARAVASRSPPAATSPISPSGPAAGDAKPRASTKRLPPRDVKVHAPRTTDARAHKAMASGDGDGVVVSDDDDVPPEPRTIDHRAGNPRGGAKPAESGPSSAAGPAGISAADLSKLWSSVGIQLGKLSRDKSQDLWSRYELLHHGSLMSASAAERDAAAAELHRIAAEASRLAH
jgi:serine/threonine protein kinase